MCPVGYGSNRGRQYLEAHGSYFLFVMMAAMWEVNTHTRNVSEGHAFLTTISGDCFHLSFTPHFSFTNVGWFS